MLKTLPLLLLLLAACGSGGSEDAQPLNEGNETAAAPATAPPLSPPPGASGGLPDDRTPVAEPPIDQKSAQGAAQVLQTYYALIEAGKYEEAWELRSPGARDGPDSKAAFVESFGRYAEYHATVGAAGRVEGAAGSLYIEIPVQLYGRMKDGTPFGSAGTVTLRRVNDVPGSTEEQRSWRIYAGS